MFFILLLVLVFGAAVYTQRKNPLGVPGWVIGVSAFAQLFFFLLVALVTLVLFPLVLVAFVIMRALGFPFFPNLPFTIHRWTFDRGFRARSEGRSSSYETVRESFSVKRYQAYETLGLNPGASEKEIHAAHRKLMKKHHPDHGGSVEMASKINQARDILLNS